MGGLRAVMGSALDLVCSLRLAASIVKEIPSGASLARFFN
jgi:hypothetical protein